MRVIGTGICVDYARENIIGTRLLKTILLTLVASNERFKDFIFRPISQ